MFGVFHPFWHLGHLMSMLICVHWGTGEVGDAKKTEAAYLIYDQSSLVIAVLLEYQILYVKLQDQWNGPYFFS